MSPWLVPFEGRNFSGSMNQNFLWQSGNVYIMDNHRAALWCWMQHLAPGQAVELLHVDQHYDTMKVVDAEWLDSVPDMRGLSVKDYLSFEQPGVEGESIPLFRWDNYLSIFLATSGEQISKCHFVTHGVGDEPIHDRIVEVQPRDLLQHLEWEVCQQEALAIVNVDLDYFALHAPAGWLQFFSQGYIAAFFAKLKAMQAEGKIAVLTLCLSPECVGGWANAEKLCRAACSALGINFALPPSP